MGCCAGAKKPHCFMPTFCTCRTDVHSHNKHKRSCNKTQCAHKHQLIRGLETRSTPSSFPRNERSVVLQPWRAPRPPPPLISAAPSETLPTHLSNAPCLFAAGCPGRTRKDEHTTKGGREFLFFASHQSLYSQKRQILHFDQRF